jgi:hypothetical protein
MKAKEKGEKDKIKLRYAVGLARALEDSSFNSFRDLALNTGLEPAHIQRISVGKVDVALTTSISLAEGLGITYAELSSYYDEVTEKQIQEFLKMIESRQRKKGNAIGTKHTRPQKKKSTNKDRSK